MKFNEFMRNARENKGYTQQKAADMIGVSLLTIQNWESGKNKPNDETIWKQICKTYDLTLDDFLDYYSLDLKEEMTNGEENEFKYKDLLPTYFDCSRLKNLKFNKIEQDVFLTISKLKKEELYLPILFNKYDTLSTINAIDKMKKLGLVEDIDNNLCLTNKGYGVYNSIIKNNRLFNIYNLSFREAYNIFIEDFEELELIGKEVLDLEYSKFIKLLEMSKGFKNIDDDVKVMCKNLGIRSDYIGLVRESAIVDKNEKAMNLIDFNKDAIYKEICNNIYIKILSDRSIPTKDINREYYTSNPKYSKKVLEILYLKRENRIKEMYIALCEVLDTTEKNLYKWIDNLDDITEEELCKFFCDIQREVRYEFEPTDKLKSFLKEYYKDVNLIK